MARLSPRLLAGAGLLLLAVTALVLWLVPSGDFLLIPDPAHPVAPLVVVQGAKQHRSEIYFVDVIERRATLFESFFPGIREGSSLVPAQELLPPCGGETLMREAARSEMRRSQEVAAAVALRAAGYRVRARPTGVVVSQVFSDSRAICKLRPTDVIVSANGRPVRTIAQLHAVLAPVEVGAVVRLGVRRGTQALSVAVRTVAAPDDRNRAIVGFVPGQSTAVHLPISVRIDANGVGGPSAGLAFALEVLEQLGRNVDHGHRVAATGEIEADGRVGPIGGVKQKTFGARAAKVDVFLVPAGDNAREARRYAQGLRIVPVKSFQQALRALATLPPEQ